MQYVKIGFFVRDTMRISSVQDGLCGLTNPNPILNRKTIKVLLYIYMARSLVHS